MIKPKGPTPIPPKDRLRYEIAKNGCWNWTGCINRFGYGIIGVGSKYDGTSKLERTHRVSYELHVGPIPKGMSILHSCGNRRCLNPRHLRPGTQKDNMLDACLSGSFARALNKQQVLDIREMRSTGKAQSTIAKVFGISQSTVSEVCLRKTWAWLQ